MLEVNRGLIRVGVMKAIGAVVAVVLAGALVLPGGPGRAQGTSAGVRVAQAGPADTPPRLRRVPRLRIYPNDEAIPEVYPRYNPGPNAVRECNATYVQEYRPSGTVIVPRMHCFWRPG
jgi:hypothetical protein